MKTENKSNELLKAYFAQNTKDEKIAYADEIRAEADMCAECCSCCRICMLRS